MLLYIESKSAGYIKLWSCSLSTDHKYMNPSTFQICKRVISLCMKEYKHAFKMKDTPPREIGAAVV